MLNLTGSNASLINAGGYIQVGKAADSQTLIFSNGATTSGLNDLWIGFDAGADHNRTTFTGTNTTGSFEWNAGSGISGSNNTLEILDGATLSLGHSDPNSGAAYLGYNEGSSNNSLLVSGTGSTLTTTTRVWLGHTGDDNTLTVESGGSVSTQTTYIGLEAASADNVLNINEGGTYTTSSIIFGTGGGNTANLNTGGTLNLNGSTVMTAGTLNVSGGTFEINDSLEIAGGILNLTAGTLDINGTFDPAAGTGTFNFSGGQLNLNANSTTTLDDSFAIGGAMTLNGGTLITGAFDASHSGFSYLSGTLQSSGQLDNLGTITALMTVTLPSSASFGTPTTLTVSETLGYLAAALDNNQRAILAGLDNLAPGRNVILEGATATVLGDWTTTAVTLLAESELNIHTLDAVNSDFQSGTLNVTGTLSNVGTVPSEVTLHLDGGTLSGAPANLAAGSKFDNNGTVTTQTTNSGSLSGNGTFTQDLVLTASSLWQPAFTFSEGTLLNDTITVTGELSLDGTLKVVHPDAYTAVAGASFTLWTAGSTTGAFDSFDLPTLPTGLFWYTTELAQTGILRIGSAPETFVDYASAQGLVEASSGDDDKDGVLNIFEYIGGSDPMVANPDPLQLETAPSKFSFQLVNPIGSDIIINLQRNTGLTSAGWQTIATRTGNRDWTGGTLVTTSATEGSTKTYQVDHPAAQPQLFYRLEASSTSEDN